jgi:hypothetical protein
MFLFLYFAPRICWRNLYKEKKNDGSGRPIQMYINGQCFCDEKIRKTLFLLLYVFAFPLLSLPLFFFGHSLEHNWALLKMTFPISARTTVEDSFFSNLFGKEPSWCLTQNRILILHFDYFSHGCICWYSMD